MTYNLKRFIWAVKNVQLRENIFHHLSEKTVEIKGGGMAEDSSGMFTGIVSPFLSQLGGFSHRGCRSLKAFVVGFTHGS